MAKMNIVVPPGRPAIMPPHRWKIEIVGGLSLLGLLTILAVLFTLTTTPTKKIVTLKENYPGVPESFTNFSGKVTSMSGNVLQVEFSAITPTGSVTQRAYAVTIDSHTTVQSITATDASGVSTSATIADITPDANVIVAGNKDLAPLSAFTATTLTIVKSSI